MSSIFLSPVTVCPMSVCACLLLGGVEDPLDVLSLKVSFVPQKSPRSWLQICVMGLVYLCLLIIEEHAPNLSTVAQVLALLQEPETLHTRLVRVGMSHVSYEWVMSLRNKSHTLWLLQVHAPSLSTVAQVLKTLHITHDTCACSLFVSDMTHSLETGSCDVSLPRQEPTGAHTRLVCATRSYETELIL